MSFKATRRTSLVVSSLAVAAACATFAFSQPAPTWQPVGPPSGPDTTCKAKPVDCNTVNGCNFNGGGCSVCLWGGPGNPPTTQLCAPQPGGECSYQTHARVGCGTQTQGICAAGVCGGPWVGSPNPCNVPHC